MRVRSTLRFAAVATTVALSGVALGVPAHADEVRTLTGPTTSSPDVYMTYVGCDSFFGDVVAPQSRLNLGPFAAPMGRRSLGLVPSGPGTASGPFSRFDSLAGLDTTLSTTGTSGVSYVWAVTAGTPPGSAWSGRAVVGAAPAGGWTKVSTAALAYDWTLVDLTTRAPVGTAAAATPGQFAAEHGDGIGFVVTGFGCDGRSFNIDAVSAGGLLLDFEGIALHTDIAITTQQVGKDGRVEITGTVRDGSGRVTGDPLVLESRVPGGQWSATGDRVLADEKGVARADAPVTETTEFRWHRPESQYADEGWSDVVTVTVAAPATPGA